MFLENRKLLVGADVVPSKENRIAITEITDEWLSSLAKAAGFDKLKVALVAVGGYGRKELCAGSDLDILLLHHQAEKPEEIARLADAIWYPVWDSGISLDHSVRDVSQVRRMASTDFKVVLGLLDARVIYGDEQLLNEVRASVLADWRSFSQERLLELQQSAMDRKQRFGDIAHLLEPDIKESYGGLREATILRSIAASWITDVNRERIDEAHQTLLDVRDALHRVTGRSTDKMTMHEQRDVAKLLGLESDDVLLRKVSMAGRALAYESDMAWARVQKVTTKKSLFKSRKIAKDFRAPLADGVVVQDEEVVLARDANPVTDSGLGWRVAAAASQAGLPVSQATLSRLKNELAPMPKPWPKEALNSLVSFLGSGPALIQVWEAFDQNGLINDLLPLWQPMQATPQRNALHIYTVDRHSIECVVQASILSRMVSRPDLLLVGALFHDIGKPHEGDHSIVGAELMKEIAVTLGFNEVDAETLCEMVRLHLLIPEVATRRDLEEPATIDLVANQVVDLNLLELLHNLTIADSKATSEHTWSEWKASLVSQLVARVEARFVGKELPSFQGLETTFPFTPSKETEISVVNAGSQSDIFIATEDRVGLVADVAGALRVLRLDIKSAQFETTEGIALQHWQVIPLFGDAPETKKIILELQIAMNNPEMVFKAMQKVKSPRVQRGFTPPKPRVRFVDGASSRSDVFEVRAHDESALLHRIAQIVAMEKLTINAARIDTIGSEVVDVLYLTTSTGGRLDETTKSGLIFKVEAELLELINLDPS
ncbi:MAG: [protein-PII] uridylyltransferase [Actinobacteria bacterium]|nr:[protein-PII] uridylyltransferase [Actinomycetota bacterium]